MITIITRWESSQMPEVTEWQMWRQLKGAFGVNRLVFVPTVHKMDGYTFDQYDTVEEALESCGDATRIFLEPTGYNTVADLPRDDDVVLVFGNTKYSNMDQAHVNETYAIATPNNTDLYGINAAAIALAYLYGQ